MDTQLHDLYHADCCTPTATALPNLADDDLAAELLKMLQQVWADKGLPEGLINEAVTTAFAKKLFTAVQDGFGVNFGSIDYDTPDYEMLQALQTNVWHFSAAKNYTQLRELSNALIDTDGKLRTFSQFKQIALQINDKHVNQYLKTEYNLAVTGGQMAGKWVNIEANKDILPLLEFDAVIDTQTTDLCRRLNGTILPVDHPFWSTYYLPNHFGERSTIRQLTSGKVTQAENIPSADIPDMFKTNLAKEGLIYPKGHSYFIDNPAGIADAAMAAMQKNK